MTSFLQAKNLGDKQTLLHGFFTREGGVSPAPYDSLNAALLSKDDPSNRAENRARIAQSLGIDPSRLLLCEQVHGTTIVTVGAPWPNEQSPKADGMVTREKNLALAVQTADCVPVLLADEAAGVIGVAHAGWRSALDGVTDRTMEAMEALGAERSRIEAALGPCIWQDSYEVDDAYMDVFMQADTQNSRFFVESDREGHWMFDLPAYVRARLVASGVASCSLPPADTCADKGRFFSYRRAQQESNGETGRQLSVLMLKG